MVLIRDARLGVGFPRADVLVRDGVIAAVGPSAVARARPDERIVAGGECTLLPGLQDHHVHLGAWLRAQRSVPVSAEGIAATLATTAPDERGWRVVYGIDHEAGVTEALGEVSAVRGPCLVVHRTGRAAVLNAEAAVALGVGRVAAVHHGRGLWGRALGPADPEWERRQLARLAGDLLAQGVVAVQDATPYPAGAAGRCAWLRAGLSPVRVGFMGDPLSPVDGALWTKLLRPHGVGASRLPLAVHAVEPAEIVAAVELARSHRSSGARPHRIEHAALCPPAVVDLVALSGVVVCANPGFLVERRVALAPLAATGEGRFLHPVADLGEAGVPVVYGSDAPVTVPGVWSAYDAARERGTDAVPFAGRGVSVRAALEALVSWPVPATPDGWVGRPADLVLVPDRRLAGDRGVAPAALTLVAGEPVAG